MLSGKHLIVGEFGRGLPYATQDNSSPSGWAGLDIAILDRIAGMLNFTYEIHEAVWPVDVASFEDVLALNVQQSDLLMGQY